ncbi:NUDIX hydrolase [Candidatus Roizmanbacteria bacterium]|nr:NUDIX hydrolase [Candidatus Roizmanbacteria bacterium]
MTTYSAWKKLSSRTVYKNQWIKIHEDQVIQPNGEESVYGLLEGKEYVMVIPRLKPNSFCMIEQYRYPIKQFSLEFPAGGLKKGENVIDALKRELQEEAQLYSNKLTKLGCLDIGNNFTNMHFYVYLAEEVSIAPKKPHDPSEGQIKIRTLSLAEIKKRIKDGIIKDGQTVAAFNLFLLNQ